MWITINFTFSPDHTFLPPLISKAGEVGMWSPPFSWCYCRRGVLEAKGSREEEGDSEKGRDGKVVEEGRGKEGRFVRYFSFSIICLWERERERERERIYYLTLYSARQGLKTKSHVARTRVCLRNGVKREKVQQANKGVVWSGVLADKGWSNLGSVSSALRYSH